MSTPEIDEYYDVTAQRDARDDLKQAAALAAATEKSPLVAIDCGCGAGANVAYLRSQGFSVHGFDVEAAAIARCRSRFADDPKVQLEVADFASFSYPPAALVVADASLFFCPPSAFEMVWRKISTALAPGGVFYGGFLGPRDTMASSAYDPEAFWPEVMTVTERELRPRFEGFDIITWNELEIDGETAQGKPHHWHMFVVTARKS